MNIIELAHEAELATLIDSYGMHDHLIRFAQLVRAEALEEAAQTCDDLWQDDGSAYDCREAIRALAKEKA